MAQTDVRQDGADYNRLAGEWKESFQRRDGIFPVGPSMPRLAARTARKPPLFVELTLVVAPQETLDEAA